jgi:hypothetical protein
MLTLASSGWVVDLVLARLLELAARLGSRNNIIVSEGGNYGQKSITRSVRGKIGKRGGG